MLDEYCSRKPQEIGNHKRVKRKRVFTKSREKIPQLSDEVAFLLFSNKRKSEIVLGNNSSNRNVQEKEAFRLSSGFYVIVAKNQRKK